MSQYSSAHAGWMDPPSGQSPDTAFDVDDILVDDVTGAVISDGESVLTKD